MQRHRGIILAGILASLVIICVCLIRARSPGPAPAVTGNIPRPPATTGSTDTRIDFEEPFIPDIETPGIPSDDEALAAWSKYVGEANKAESAGNYGEAARLWEEYLREYPIGPFAWRAMLRLGWTYEKLGRIDDARRMMYATKELVGEDRMGNTVEINLAQLDRKLGDNRAAEERLRNLMAKPAGDKFDDG